MIRNGKKYTIFESELLSPCYECDLLKECEAFIPDKNKDLYNLCSKKLRAGQCYKEVTND